MIDMVAGLALMSAAIFGNVSSIMLRLYRGTEEYHEKLTSIREFIKFHFIPKPLANRLIESYQHSRSFTHGVDMNAVSPPQLSCCVVAQRQDVGLVIYRSRVQFPAGGFHVT